MPALVHAAAIMILICSTRRAALTPLQELSLFISPHTKLNLAFFRPSGPAAMPPPLGVKYLLAPFVRSIRPPPSLDPREGRAKKGNGAWGQMKK